MKADKHQTKKIWLLQQQKKLFKKDFGSKKFFIKKSFLFKKVFVLSCSACLGVSLLNLTSNGKVTPQKLKSLRLKFLRLKSLGLKSLRLKSLSLAAVPVAALGFEMKWKYHIPGTLLKAFLGIAKENKPEGLHLETLGLLVGFRENDTLTATYIILPAQNGTSSIVIDQGRIFKKGSLTHIY